MCVSEEGIDPVRRAGITRVWCQRANRSSRGLRLGTLSVSKALQDPHLVGRQQVSKYTSTQM